MDFLQLIKEKKDKLLYDYGRNKFLTKTIANIGDIEEEEDCIICIVKQDLLDKNAKPNFYQLDLDGMNTYYDKGKEIVDYYKLNKPVHYIFDGIHFDTPININSYFCDITFVNCVFSHSWITIFNADEITFSKNTFLDATSIVSNQAFLRILSNTKIRKLYFIDENFVNKSKLKKYGENKFGINIVADEIHIYKSTIITDETNGNLFMKAKKIDIAKSTIHSPEIYFDTNHIDNTKSSLIATKGIIVGNTNSNSNIEICLDDVYSPYVLFNNIEWVNYKTGNRVFFHDYPKLLNEKRKEVTNKLQNLDQIVNHIMDSNAKITQNEEKELNTPIKELLKRK